MSERQGVEFDSCPRCRGDWLDREELDNILQRSALAARVPEGPFNGEPRDSYRDRTGEHWDDDSGGAPRALQAGIVLEHLTHEAIRLPHGVQREHIL